MAQSESTEQDILSNLQTDMQNDIDGSGEYWFNVKKVDQGFTKWEDTNGNRPFIWFEPVDTVYEELQDAEVDGMMTIELQGYIDRRSSDGSEVHKLLKDIRYFFYNDYSHDSVQAVFIDSAGFDVGSRYDELGRSGVVVKIRLLYSFTTTNL